MVIGVVVFVQQNHLHYDIQMPDHFKLNIMGWPPTFVIFAI